MCRFRLAILLFYALSGVTFGQTKSAVGKQIEMPSESEVRELLSEANQKVVAFEEAVKAAKVQLDKIDPKLGANYLDAASWLSTPRAIPCFCPAPGN